MQRKEALERLQKTIAEGRAIIGTGSGIGLSAACAERAGADLIGVATSSRFRMAGRGALAGMMPYANANDTVLSLAGEILPVVRSTPVLANLCGTDPLRSIPELLRKVKELGFTGVQNFPTVGMIDGTFRQSLEETGMGFDLEIAMIARARDADLLTCPYVFDPQQAVEMVRVGADIVIPHLGITTKGVGGGKSAVSLEEAVSRVQAIRDAAMTANPEIIVLCHGGPIATPEDARFVLEHARGLHGFFGGASTDVLAAEPAMVAYMQEFRRLRLGAR